MSRRCDHHLYGTWRYSTCSGRNTCTSVNYRNRENHQGDSGQFNSTGWFLKTMLRAMTFFPTAYHSLMWLQIWIAGDKLRFSSWEKPACCLPSLAGSAPDFPFHLLYLWERLVRWKRSISLHLCDPHAGFGFACHLGWHHVWPKICNKRPDGALSSTTGSGSGIFSPRLKLIFETVILI